MTYYQVELQKQLYETERNLLAKALQESNGNKRKAASILGMPRSTLYKKIKEYELDAS